MISNTLTETQVHNEPNKNEIAKKLDDIEKSSTSSEYSLSWYSDDDEIESNEIKNK